MAPPQALCDTPQRVALAFPRPGIAVITLIGEHDLAGKQRLGEALASASARPNVLVDLSGCTFMDSSVIGALFSARSRLVERGGRLELVIPPEATIVRRIVDLARLHTLVPIHPADAEGFASLQARR